MVKDPAAVSYLQTVCFLKGFHAVQTQRVSNAFWARGDAEGRQVAFALQNRAFLSTGKRRTTR
jgi:serine acetyltransferase